MKKKKSKGIRKRRRGRGRGNGKKEGREVEEKADLFAFSFQKPTGTLENFQGSQLAAGKMDERSFGGEPAKRLNSAPPLFLEKSSRVIEYH